MSLFVHLIRNLLGVELLEVGFEVGFLFVEVVLLLLQKPLLPLHQLQSVAEDLKPLFQLRHSARNNSEKPLLGLDSIIILVIFEALWIEELPVLIVVEFLGVLVELVDFPEPLNGGVEHLEVLLVIVVVFGVFGVDRLVV